MASEAPGWTPYRFCFNNPVNIVDPTGLFEDHWEIDNLGNATLIDTEGDEIIVNGQNITDYDFSGKEKAFSQINQHYGSEAGVSSDASYPSLHFDKKGNLISDDTPSDWAITKQPQALQAKSNAMTGKGQGIIGSLHDGTVYDKTTYSSKNNLINSMAHEKKHLLQNKSSYSSFDELDAIMYQMGHSSWGGTTSGHKAEIKAYGLENYKQLKPYYEGTENGRYWLNKFKKGIGF
jgi:hypothetical protein